MWGQIIPKGPINQLKKKKNKKEHEKKSFNLSFSNNCSRFEKGLNFNIICDEFCRASMTIKHFELRFHSYGY